MIAQRYRGTVREDMLLAGWFYTLHQTGEWHDCFIHPPDGIGWFYAYFQRDVQLWYVEEHQRLIFAGWFERMPYNGAFFALWIDAAHRHTSRMPQAVGELLAQEFERVRIILGFTKQEKLLDCYQKMGYTVIGQIPALWAGAPVWLISLNVAQLQGGTYGRLIRRQGSRHVGAAGLTSSSVHRATDGASPSTARAGSGERNPANGLGPLHASPYDSAGA